MKVALYGFGKMGRAIAEVCARGHEVVLTVDRTPNAGTPPTGADVAIEFSRPATAVANMRLCLEHGVPVVVGTTGWYDHLPEVKSLVGEHRGGLLWASNFSIGVSLFFRLNRQLAALMDPTRPTGCMWTRCTMCTSWTPQRDGPFLARDIDLATKRFTGWRKAEAANRSPRAQCPSPANAPARCRASIRELDQRRGPAHHHPTRPSGGRVCHRRRGGRRMAGRAHGAVHDGRRSWRMNA